MDFFPKILTQSVLLEMYIFTFTTARIYVYGMFDPAVTFKL